MKINLILKEINMSIKDLKDLIEKLKDIKLHKDDVNQLLII